jgi:hypothetical protein
MLVWAMRPVPPLFKFQPSCFAAARMAAKRSTLVHHGRDAASRPDIAEQSSGNLADNIPTLG